MTTVNMNALESDIRKATINQKANACPMMIRLAWHAAGTFDKSDGSGGTDGATMRFAPESTDDANAGLSIVRDLLKPVAKSHPNISVADIWCHAGAMAVEFAGGPKVPVSLGRTDSAGGAGDIPPNGRLPDAAQGAAHLRDVFGRQGFNDQEIVALSGAHTLGRCHMVRSGFDG
jgi:catalase (peroxidase I)